MSSARAPDLPPLSLLSPEETGTGGDTDHKGESLVSHLLQAYPSIPVIMGNAGCRQLPSTAATAASSPNLSSGTGSSKPYLQNSQCSALAFFTFPGQGWSGWVPPDPQAFSSSWRSTEISVTPAADEGLQGE